ncbi:MAG: hypothetical protein QM765_40750 [Myxococcales bacterium]
MKKVRVRPATLRILAWLGLLAGLVAAHAFLLRGEVLVSRDYSRIFIPDAFFERQSLLSGELPLWNPQVRLGQPFAAGLLQQAWYPPRLLPILLFGPVWGLTVEHLLHVVFAAWGAVLAARRLGASRVASLLPGALFGLGTLLTRTDMVNLTGALAWSGWMLAASIDVARGSGWKPVARLGAFTGLSALTGLPEALLWQGPACAIAALSTRGSWRTLARVAAGGLWGLALAAITVVPAVEFAAHSSRTGQAQPTTFWSLSWVDLLALVVRGANRPLIDMLTEQALVLGLDLGVVACVLCAFALLGRRRRRRLAPLLGFAMLLALLSLGSNFAPSAWVLEQFPFRLFRYPVKYALGACFLASVLAGPALSRLAALASRRRARLKLVALLFPILVVAALAVAAATAGLGLRQGFAAGLLPTAVLLWLVSAAYLASPGKGRRRARIVTWALVAVGLADVALAQITTGKLLTLPASSITGRSKTALSIPAQATSRVSIGSDLDQEWPPRTLDAIPPGASPRYLAAARDALIPNWSLAEGLQTLEATGEPRPALLQNLVGEDEPPRGLYDLAGVEWYVRRASPPFADLERVSGPTGPFRDVFEQLADLPVLYRSRTAMPRAFVVHQVRAATDEEARTALRDERQPLRDTALVAADASGGGVPAVDACAGSTATVASRRPRQLEIDVDACGRGLLVVSDAWYPGWQASIDGADAPVLRTDLLVRGVPVPAGRHRVVLRFAPTSFAVGAGLSFAAILLAVAVSWRRRTPS